MLRIVRDRGPRLWLDWALIGAKTVGPHDFEPSFVGSWRRSRTWRAARAEQGQMVLVNQHERQALADPWRSAGREDTKDAAVAALEREFTNYLAGTPPKPSPYAQVKRV